VQQVLRRWNPELLVEPESTFPHGVYNLMCSDAPGSSGAVTLDAESVLLIRDGASRVRPKERDVGRLGQRATQCYCQHLRVHGALSGGEAPNEALRVEVGRDLGVIEGTHE
jgi:hypothetical protein